MFMLLGCETHCGTASVVLVCDAGGLPVYIAADLRNALCHVLDRGEDEIAFAGENGPEVYRIGALDPSRPPNRGGPFSRVRVLLVDPDTLPELPRIGTVMMGDNGTEPTTLKVTPGPGPRLDPA